MIYIYSHTVTERLKYTLNVLLNTILQVDYKLVDKSSFIEKKIHPRINYSHDEIEDCVQIMPHKLLFEKTINLQNIAVTYKREIPYFFQFDLFASSFYMLSRYEEYLSFKADEYGRFPVHQSLAYKANFLQLPVVNIWANELGDALHKKYPKLIFPKNTYTQHNTIDIDYAYHFKGKPVVRQIGMFLKSIFTFDFLEIKKQLFYRINGIDPFDVYDRLQQLQKDSNSKTTYFFQVGSYDEFDKNIPLKKTLSDLIKRVSNYADIGLHPSYGSNTNFKKLKEEHQNISNVLGYTITKSRQHYLKLTFPETFENLIKLKVKEDYSLGFSGGIGFRAGIATPFPFFNLELNEIRPLLFFPFQVMDVSLKDYLKQSPGEALESVEAIKKSVRDVNGEFTSLFHNSSLTDKGEWTGWSAVYKEVIKS